MNNKNMEEEMLEYQYFALNAEKPIYADDAFCAGYKAAQRKLQQHVQILEMQLQQAQSRIMLLEAKMETMR